MNRYSHVVVAVLVAAMSISNAAAQEGDETQTLVEKGSAEDAFVVEEPDALQLNESEATRSIVRMYCNTTSGNHTVQIRAYNSSNRNITCTSRCYYRRSDGYNGVLRCTGTVGANASNQLFCNAYNSRYTYRVTNPGSNNCP
jgi:hypothetical protein